MSAEPSCSSIFQRGSAASSLCLIISHSLPFSLCFSLTRTKLPRSFSPWRLNLISPRAICRAASPSPSTLKSAAVPDHHRAGAVVAFGDGALEAAVVQRMVFGLHGQALVGGIERRPLGHGPGYQHAADFEAKVIVQAPRGVLLHDEGVLLRARPFAQAAAPACAGNGACGDIPAEEPWSDSSLDARKERIGRTWPGRQVTARGRYGDVSSCIRYAGRNTFKAAIQGESWPTRSGRATSRSG